MLMPFQSILLATDLSENCLPALSTSLSMAKQHNARVVLLHVIARPRREVPVSLEDYFSTILGEEKWREIKEEQESEARSALIGKMSSRKILQQVIRRQSTTLDLEDFFQDLKWEAVVVAEKNISRAILQQAGEHECDVIVLGSGKGFWGSNAVGSTSKHVMYHSDVPVMLVPSKSSSSGPTSTISG